MSTAPRPGCRAGQPAEADRPQLTQLVQTTLQRQPGIQASLIRKGSGRKRGGQPGHPGAGQEMLPVERCQASHDHGPGNTCRRCSNPLAGVDPAPHRHQVIDIQPIRTEVIQHRLHRVHCPRCSTSTCASCPPWGGEQLQRPTPQFPGGFLAVRFRRALARHQSCWNGCSGCRSASERSWRFGRGWRPACANRRGQSRGSSRLVVGADDTNAHGVF
jgi:hypothetical protein